MSPVQGSLCEKSSARHLDDDDVRTYRELFTTRDVQPFEFRLELFATHVRRGRPSVRRVRRVRYVFKGVLPQ